MAGVAIRGAYFTGLSLAARQIISFGTVVLLARILTPADFGLAAIIFVLIGFAQVVGDVGFSAGLVRTQTDSTIAINTVFWLSLSTGGFLAGCVFFAAPFGATFYRNEAVEEMLQVSSLGLILNFCLPVPLAILQKRLAYKEISLSQALGSLAGALFAIVGVFFGLGIWGLILQPIVGNFISLVLMLKQSHWMPRFEFSLTSVKPILSDGINLLGASLTQYGRGNVDSALIGRALTTSDLGIYSMARTLLYAPNYVITSVVSRVIFPLLSKVQHNKGDVESVILLSIKKIAILAFPLYVGLWLLAPEIVLFVFGPQWIQMVDILKLMIAAALVQSIGNICPPVLIALGASRLNFYLSLGGLIGYVGVLIVTVQFGLPAVALGYTLANVALSVLSIWVAASVSRVDSFALLKVVANPLVISLCMGVVVYFTSLSLPLEVPFRLGVIVLIGFCSYLCLVALTERKLIKQVRSAFF
ncbi:MAG: lipopolysaccharide biosynthesis protein [Polynucleobacter sp.]|nr:lipopolysaccharide biosynthesis protein [Polynucleobacter sp.]